MKSKIKAVCCALLATTMAVSMAACSGGNENLVSGSSSNATGEKVKLTFLRAGTEDYKKAAFQEIISNFEKKYPNYTVEYQEAPWGNDIETKLNTSFASGTAPDVINYSLASIGARVPLGQYECLNDYTKDWEGKSDYYDSVLKAGTIGDKLYGIGYLADSRVFVYNTDMFEKAGLDPNTPPTTWDELKADHEKLVKKDKSGNVIQTGFGAPTHGTNVNQWLEIFGIQNGVDNLIDEANNKVLFNSEGSIEAMKYLKELNDIGLITWDFGHADENPLANGTAAMSIVSQNEYVSMNTGDLEGKLKIAPMFANKNDGTFCGMHFMFMNSASKHKNDAWNLIEFMTEKDSEQIWCDKVGNAPLRESMKDDYLKKNAENGETILKAIEIGKGSPKVPYFQTVFNNVDDAMEQIYYGKTSVEDALNDAAKKVQDEIDNQ